MPTDEADSRRSEELFLDSCIERSLVFFDAGLIPPIRENPLHQRRSAFYCKDG